MRNKRGKRGAEPAEAGLQPCGMCGQAVRVDGVGRCPLGHHVGVSPAPPAQAAATHRQPPAATPPEPAAVTLPEPAPVTPSEPAVVTPSEPAVVTPSDPAVVTFPEPAASAASFGDVLVWDSIPEHLVTAEGPLEVQPSSLSPASPTPAGAPTAPRAAVDELLAWDEPVHATSALDMQTADLPVPPPPPREQAPDPQPAEVEPDGAAEIRRARGRAAALLGGLVATGMVVVAALQLAL